MGALKLSEHAHVADAVSGRRHGRVKRVLLAEIDVVTKVRPEPRFVVEWADGARSEHAADDLVARFTSQSTNFGRVF